MKSTHTRAILSAMLALVILLSTLCSCSGNKIYADDLMAGIKADKAKVRKIDDDFKNAYLKFALDIWQEAREGDENVMISPLSIMTALAMTANGAKGDTLSQMEDVLGGIDIKKLNEYLYSYVSSLASEDGYKLETANSLWIKNDPSFAVKEKFLKKCAGYYFADAYTTPFDTQTVDDINGWISENTDGMIEKMLDQVSEDALLYLISTVFFDARWAVEYDSRAIVNDRTFMSLYNEKQSATMMYSTEYKYIEDSDCVGFLKPYKEGKYSFTAFLPNSDVDFDEFILSLDAERFAGLIEGATDENVDVVIPEFECEYKSPDDELKDILRSLGMVDAFEDSADFSGISDTPLNIGQVIHQTKIEVNSNGTKAAAATIVDFFAGGMSHQVTLDRPFVYAIIDNECGLPIFIGELTSLS